MSHENKKSHSHEGKTISRYVCNFFALSSFVPAVRRCRREETRTFKLRSEWKIRETRASKRRRVLERGRRRDSETMDKQEGRNRHVAVLRSTAHNAQSESREGEKGLKYIIIEMQ